MLLLASGCLGMSSGEAAGDEVPPYYPPAGVDVRSYDLALTLDPETRRLDGRALLDVRHPDTLSVLPLLFSELEVRGVQVDGRPVEAERRPGARLLVPLADGDTASTVEIRYTGVPPTGLYASPYEGERVVFTDSWPDRARGWLPGVHHPSDPATLNLTLTLPRGWEPVATGALTEQDTLGGKVRFHWSLRTPAPTYAFAFALGDFVTVEDGQAAGVPIRYHMLEGEAERANRLARTPAVIDYFSEWLGPYPYAQYASAQVPIGYGGMENASLAFLRAGLFEGPLRVRPDTTAAEAVQIHEAVHMWFGDQVVIAEWRDLWLSEGVATYLTTLFYEHANGLDRARREWTAMAALSEEDLSTHGALVPEGPVDPDDHLTWIPYRKGASVLHLLRLVMGDDAFFEAFRRAYARFKDQPLSTEDFRALLEETSGRELDALFDYWVYGTELPTLRTTWDADARTLSWQITGDAGTLDGVPFLLAVRQNNETQYVEATAGQVTLDGEAAPTVQPVGIMLVVE